MVVTTGKGAGRAGKGGQMFGDGQFTLGDRHAIQYTYGISQNCTLENYIILLTNVTSNKYNF